MKTIDPISCFDFKPQTFEMFSVERNLRGHQGPIMSLAFSPNMKQLVSCSSDKSLILWGLQQRMKGYRSVELMASFLHLTEQTHSAICRLGG